MTISAVVIGDSLYGVGDTARCVGVTKALGEEAKGRRGEEAKGRRGEGAKRRRGEKASLRMTF
ncbi:MAG: hypothetical protein IPF59_11925 [Ignavibacteria bacterium]|nr:hypothetical protein [Ignavibacteria bacterium]MBK7411483.1 hypothetical protein [Ignavibacteria bacterium]